MRGDHEPSEWLRRDFFEIWVLTQRGRHAVEMVANGGNRAFFRNGDCGLRDLCLCGVVIWGNSPDAPASRAKTGVICVRETDENAERGDDSPGFASLLGLSLFFDLVIRVNGRKIRAGRLGLESVLNWESPGRNACPTIPQDAWPPGSDVWQAGMPATIGPAPIVGFSCRLVSVRNRKEYCR
jgi:hypothetical protein